MTKLQPNQAKYKFHLFAMTTKVPIHPTNNYSKKINKKRKLDGRPKTATLTKVRS